MTAALTGHGLRLVNPPRAIVLSTLAFGGDGKVGTTLRRFPGCRFLGCFALGDDELNGWYDFYLGRLRQYRTLAVVNDVFLIRHGMHSLCNDD
jgi:hypothetical protein